MAYTEVTISSYNATPPTDDGATDTANEITWAGVKTKLGDPLDTAFDSIDTNVASACGTLDTAITSANSSNSTISTNLTTALTALYAPVGTLMVFRQTSAPTLWTKSSTHNDKMLRLVTGTVSSGGTTAFSTVFGARTLGSAMATHTHTVAKSGSLSFDRSSWVNSLTTSQEDGFTSGGTSAISAVSSDSGNMGTVTILFSGTTTSIGSGTAVDFDLDYMDVIIATKN